jgi:hypothetical protein
MLLQELRFVVVEPAAAAATGPLEVVVTQREKSFTGVGTRANGVHAATIAVIGSSPPFDSRRATTRVRASLPTVVARDKRVFSLREAAPVR